VDVDVESGKWMWMVESGAVPDLTQEPHKIWSVLTPITGNPNTNGICISDKLLRFKTRAPIRRFGPKIEAKFGVFIPPVKIGRDGLSV